MYEVLIGHSIKTMRQTHNCVLFHCLIAVLKRQYWQIVVNVFFTYEKEKYVKTCTYFSKNKNKIRMIRILEDCIQQ